MTAATGLDEALAAAVSLRERGDDAEALRALLELRGRHPDDPRVNLQCAWIHDKLGLEAEAVPFYEQALAAGLTGDDLHDAMLGLGSTYRALGRYEDSMRVFEAAVAEMPGARDIEVFRAITAYNLGDAKQACETLLRLLVETTEDESIRRYRAALAEYGDDLDRTWA